MTNLKNAGNAFLVDGQDGAEISLNRFMLIVDAFLPRMVFSKTTTTPPASPAIQDIYLVPASGATGAWAGKGNQIAVWSGSEWLFIPPRFGYGLTVADTLSTTIYTGAAWT
jgi:hypothetical protein